MAEEPHANGEEMPMIDLTYERQKLAYEQDKQQLLDRVPMLHSISGNHRCTFAQQIIEQMVNLHEQSMISEFESRASLLLKPEERYQLQLELEAESYNLNTVQTLATNFFMERVDASSAETVVAIYLAKMQAIRDRLSRKMQAMSAGRC